MLSKLVGIQPAGDPHQPDVVGRTGNGNPFNVPTADNVTKNSAHNNMQPFTALTYLICYEEY